MKTITLIQHQHDGMTREINGTKSYDFGKVGPRNLIKAFRMSLEETGFEGYGAPYYTHEIQVGGVALDDTDQATYLKRALRDPWLLTSRLTASWTSEQVYPEYGGKTLTKLAEAVLASAAD